MRAPPAGPPVARRRPSWLDRLRRQPTSPVPTRRAFLDPQLESRFDQDGFVVVPLLDADAVSALWSAYDLLPHRQHGDSPFAEGFHTSIYDDRTSYREAVHAGLAATVEPAMATYLDRHRMIFANYTVKLAGGGPVPCHPDWTFVDEPRFRSLTMWCALDDIDAQVGSLAVVPGSHHEVDFVRPLNVRSYERYDAIAGSRPPGRPLTLRAGEAVVMDSRCLHFSPANLGTTPRVVAACVAVPEEAVGRHYFVDDDGTLWQHAIEPGFYLHYAPGADPRGVPGAGERERVPEGSISYS